jgi:transcriptional regulator with XRE-family HTH domain
MISPYVRRLRLAQELRQAREAAGLTHDQLAKKIKGHRPTISRLENGHGAPDLDDVFKILEALGIEDQQWEAIVTIAREAAERGWWESNTKAMGERQALFANLEAGAITITDVQPSLVPGLLQTPDYIRARLDAARWEEREDPSTIDGIVEGRLGRQRMLKRPSGPTYQVILDEVVIRRATAPPVVLGPQFRHLADKAAENKIEVRILPVDALIDRFAVPTAKFSIYTYPDDPPVAAIESVGTDLVLTAEADVKRFTHLYELMRRACLTPEQTIGMLNEAADQLTPST